MAVKIKSIKKLVVNNGIKMLVHGPAGAGKTVLCCTTGESTLLISAESGLLSVREAPDYIEGAEVETLEDLEDLYDFLKDDAGPEQRYKWVALDSITEIAERVLHFEKAEAKDPRQAYGKLTDHMLDLLRRFRDLRGYHVIMSCKQRRTSDDGGPSVFGPMMPGQQLHQQIPYLFDEVFALRVEQDDDGDDYRVLQTSRDARFEAKDRSGSLDMFEDPNLKNIAGKILGSMKDIKTIDEVEEEEIEENEEAEPEEELETTETEDGQEEGAEEEAEEVEKEPAPQIAEKRLFWIDHAAEDCGVVEKGEEIPDDLPEESEFVTRLKYNKFVKELEDADTE